MAKSLSVFVCTTALLAITIGSGLAAAPGQVFHVDVNSLGGPCADSNPGTVERPWKTAMKAFTSAGPGDTVIFRRGIYRLPRTVLTADLKLDASRLEPVVFKAPTGEEVVITVMKPVASGDWKQIAVTKSGHAIFAAPSGDDGRVTNLTQDGVPLTRPFTDDPRYPHRDSLPETITGHGEWASSLRDHRVMVCTSDGKPPGDRIEVCDVRGGDGAGNLIDLQRDAQDRCRNLRLSFENLTLETGFYGLTIRTGFVELHRCTLRKSFGDLINTLSGRLLVDDCDFSAFGESAIDVTGPGDAPRPQGAPPMIIRNSRFHDNAQVRSPSPKVKGYNAVMLKGGSTDIVVEACQFYNLRITINALTLGGSTGGLSRSGQAQEGIRLTARNNIFRDITGPAPVVVFAGSEDCRFVNNLVTNCKVDDLITMERSNAFNAASGNLRPLVQNNVFHRNSVKRDLLNASPAGVAIGLIMDHNLIADSGETCRIDDVVVALKDLPARGFQTHGVSLPPLFRDAVHHNYHPAPGSPVIDHGAALRELVPLDADGTARPRGGAFDIGPFESGN